MFDITEIQTQPNQNKLSQINSIFRNKRKLTKSL